MLNNQDDLISSILERLKLDSEDQVFLKLEQMNAAKHQIIVDNLSDVEFLLCQQIDRFLRRILGHRPKSLIDRWLIVQIIADATDIYQNETTKILEQISTVIGKSLKVSKAVDWKNFAREAKIFIQAHENIYEIKAFRDVESSLIYLKHFYQICQTKEQIDSLIAKIQPALDEFIDRAYALEMYEHFDYEKFIAKEVMPEYSPNNKTVNMTVIKSAIDSWQLIPKIEKDRLLNPVNKTLLVETLINANRALKIIKLCFSDSSKSHLENLIFWLREKVKRRIKFAEYVDSQETIF